MVAIFQISMSFGVFSLSHPSLSGVRITITLISTWWLWRQPLFLCEMLTWTDTAQSSHQAVIFEPIACPSYQCLWHGSSTSTSSHSLGGLNKTTYKFHFLHYFLCIPKRKNESSVLFLSPAAKTNNSEQGSLSSAPKTSLSTSKCDPKHKDCLLREFRKLCAMVAENPSYNTKTQIIQDFLQKGSAGGRTVRTPSMCSLWKAQSHDQLYGHNTMESWHADNLEMESYSCNCRQTLHII